MRRADPAKLGELYRSLGLEMTYRSAARLVEVIRVWLVNVCEGDTSTIPAKPSAPTMDIRGRLPLGWR